jgi:hypothetical protein
LRHDLEYLRWNAFDGLAHLLAQVKLPDWKVTKGNQVLLRAAGKDSSLSCSPLAVRLDKEPHGIHRTQSRSPIFFSTAFFSAGSIWLGPIFTVSFSSFPVKLNGHA